MVSSEQFDRVTGYLEVGKKEGAKLKAGGEAGAGQGLFCEADGVYRRQQFDAYRARGDLRSGRRAIPFKDENDAVFQGNDTTYGLAAAVWTRDISRAHAVARKLKAGTVWVNCYGMLDPISPFGGYKQSGFGRELGRYAIELYTEIKSVFVKL